MSFCQATVSRMHGELAALRLEDALTVSEDFGSLESGAEWP